jgi:hypothetical protein
VVANVAVVFGALHFVNAPLLMAKNKNITPVRNMTVFLLSTSPRKKLLLVLACVHALRAIAVHC